MFKKLPISFDVSELQEALRKNDAWDLYPQRRLGDSPHAEMVDIWARFADVSDGDMSKIGRAHESVWYPCSEFLANIKQISGAVCSFVDGEYLGGVLITKLPPGGKIKPHIDNGWHASEYDKFYLAVEAPDGSAFCFDSGEIIAKPGEVYWFRNDVTHWVENNSESERISAIICVKTRAFEELKHG